jgi:hypothetical protein
VPFIPNCSHPPAFRLRPQGDFFNSLLAAGLTHTRVLQVATFTLTPDLTVPGLQNQILYMDFTGFEFSDDEAVQVTFGAGITTVSTEVVNTSRLKIVINVSSTAATGLRKATITRAGQDVETAELLTVYGGTYRGTVDNLVVLVDRPAFGTTAPVLNESALGTGPRTTGQETRLAAVIAATTRAGVTAAWNTWIRNDGSFTRRPSTITPTQLDILIDAAVAYEAANPSQPTIPGNPPAVPFSMWKGFLRYLAAEESGYQTSGCVLAMAGVSSENSYGLAQFNDVRATGNNFTGATGITVPVYHPGIVQDWKALVIAVTTIPQLRAVLIQLGTGDWRADPYSSLINVIRSSHAYYARLISTITGTVSYNANDSFRVDLAAPGRANGSGSQRDCFEFFAVAHRLVGDAFGFTDSDGTKYQGGVVYAPTPNEWHTTGGTPNLYMTAAGTARAESSGGYYKTNAPDGGYQ